MASTWEKMNDGGAIGPLGRGGDRPPGEPVEEIVMTGDREARRLTLALLAARAAGATICPSEVARALASDAETTGTQWREAMPVVHAAVDGLVAEGLVRLSWKGNALDTRAGPYRISRG